MTSMGLVEKCFDRVTGLIMALLLMLITIGIGIGLISLLQKLVSLIEFASAPGYYMKMVSEILTLFVLIELTRSLVSYFSEHRLRLTFILDAGIIFVLRELMIKLFEQTISPEEIYALSTLLFVLGCLRTGSVIVYQREKRMLEKKNRQSLREGFLNESTLP